MKWLYLSVFLITTITSLSAQNRSSLREIEPTQPDYENVHVQPLYTDSTTSTFLVFVKKEVPKHYHASHTEQVMVLEGKGRMQLGEKEIMVKKGDFIVIPAGTLHAVRVIGRKPMKVLSIQSPEFKGEDRIFVDN